MERPNEVLIEEVNILSQLHDYEMIMLNHKSDFEANFQDVENKRREIVLARIRTNKLIHLTKLMGLLSPNLVQFIKDRIEDLFGNAYDQKKLPSIDEISGLITDYNVLADLFNALKSAIEEDKIEADLEFINELIKMTLERIVIATEPILLKAISNASIVITDEVRKLEDAVKKLQEDKEAITRAKSEEEGKGEEANADLVKSYETQLAGIDTLIKGYKATIDIKKPKDK